MLLLVAGTVLVRATAVTTVLVPGTSMQPAVQAGDRLLVWRPGAEDARRGDVVVIDGTGSFDALEDPAPARERWAPPWPGPVRYVKRVVAVAGDRVSCCADDGRLELDGRPLDEPYVQPGDVPSETPFDVVVPADGLWVLGDDRSASTDSRALLGAPGGGVVPRERVEGRVVAVAWPPDRWGRVHRVR